MRFNIEESLAVSIQSPTVGNVYNVRGGSGAKYGYMMVIVAITESRMCVVLTVNKDGEIVSASSYANHYFEEKCPIAYCPNLSDLSFDIRGL